MFSFKNIITKGPFGGESLNYAGVEIFPEKPGVYFLRRGLNADPKAAVNEEYFQKWLHKSISTPYIRSQCLTVSTKKKQGLVTIRNDLINIGSFEMGGGELSGKKKVDLDEINTIKKRSSLMNLLNETLTNYGPVLYVGQTDSIQNRMKQHIAADSPLRLRLAEIGLDFENITVNLLLMPNSNENEREFLEQVLTYLLVSPLTMRPG